MPSEEPTEGGTRPNEWPEHYHGTPSPQCDHHMMWDTAEGKYICIYECGETAEEPPEAKIRNRNEQIDTPPKNGQRKQ